MMRETPPNRIREWRKKRGLSQHALGARVGTHNQQISKLETGRLRLSTHWIDKLAPALGVEPWELLNHPHGGKRVRTEQDLLRCFRSLPADRQARVLDLVRWLSESE